MLPACMRYQHRNPAPSVMVWAGIGYTTCISLVQINDNLYADCCVSDILCPVFAP